MKKKTHMCSVCFELNDRVKKDMQETLSKTPYSMARAFQLFAMYVGHNKHNPKLISDFLYDNNYVTDEDLRRISEDIENGTAKLVKHDLIEVND